MSDNAPPLSDPEWTALEAIATSEAGVTLETAAIERIASHAESAQMWRAVAERDTDVVDSDD